ncbi:hypothetical protein [Sphingomonas aracearum]|uniref:Uncharacterized protein n=1 Tax=Sphingomonas aracearum TaxID=2283317 RepID=A0A369VYX4_9SPHN|nr:hypothetical protein [Sphingomonas aracearum]RDE05021.1 hypothetical protein DVW87_13990 [Sphingomonas aracearum]
MPKFLHEFLEAALALLGSLLPAGLGAIVSMLYDMPATWAKRVTQLWIGIVVSYFVQRAIGAIYPLHPFVLQALSFWLGMIAFKAAPSFVSGCATAAGELPTIVRDRLLAFLPSKEKK